MKKATTAICSLLLAATSAIAQSGIENPNEFQQIKKTATPELALLGAVDEDVKFPLFIGAPNQEKDPIGIGILLNIPEQQVSDAKPQAFPNPSNGNIKIGVPDNMNVESITVYDYSGRVVLQQNGADSKTGLSEHQLDLRAVSSGSYIVMLNVGTKIISERIVIQK